MIEVSSGRENVEGSFREDVGIVSILGWEDDIVFLVGDSKFSRQGGFLNIFIFKRNSFLYPIDAAVVLRQPGHS